MNHRRCVSCRQLALKSDLLRLVRLHPSHAIAFSGMGRSAYLCPTQPCIQAARKKDRLGRALKATVPEEIYLALDNYFKVEET